MSTAQTTARLLRLYPAGWRARYGDELEELIVATCADRRRVPLRTRLDVALAGGRERLRAGGLDGDSPAGDQARGGLLLVLCAWALFITAGCVVQKASEHWQSFTSVRSHGVASAAFTALVVGAVGAAVVVLAGIAFALPSMRAFLRAGGLPAIRRRVLSAFLASGIAVLGTVALVLWAGGLTAAQRNGGDTAYALAFVGWALLLAVALAAWTAAAVATARRLTLSAATLRTQTRLAGVAATAMLGMTAATIVWWLTVADAATAFPATAPLVVALATMILASTLATAGARHAALAGRRSAR